MTLFVPIAPIIWALVWIFRALQGKSAPQTAVPTPKGRGTQVAVVQTLLFLLVYFPLALMAAIYAADRSPGCGWTGLAFGVTLLFLCSGPYWLAWRILGPWGFPLLGRLVLYLAPCIELESFQGNHELFSAAFGGKPKPQRWTATPWLFFVIALRRESEGSVEGIDQLLEFLAIRPPRRMPRRLLRQGVELLVWPAIRKGDWKEAQRRLAPGHGRGVRLLRRLAAIHLMPESQAPSALLLWLEWLLAPERRYTLSLVRSALARKSTAGARRVAPAALGAGGDGLWQRHLQLLARAAAGRAISAADIAALAEGWEAVLGRKGYMRLVVRAAELGAPDAQAAAAALRPAVEAELEALAEAVEGEWPEPARPGLVAKLRRRRLDRLFAAVQVEVEPFRGHNFANFPRKLDTPLAEMERWLQLRLSLRRLLSSNAEALPTAWHNGLRLAACNWPVYLLQTHGAAAFWACREMSAWCETLAREVDDQEIVKLSHGNSQVGRSRLFRR